MANTLLTPAIIAREALATLYAKTVMLPLVHRDFEPDFAKVGDTVSIRKPATFAARDFVADANTTVVQDATETSVPVVMNRHFDVTFAVTSKEMTLSLDDFRAQLLDPAMEAHAQNIDRLLAGLYTDLYWNTGTAGTTPGTLADITAVRERMNTNLVALDSRSLVVNPAAEAKMLQQEAFVNASWNNRANSDALNEAAIGRKMGLDIVMGQNIAAHDNGTIAHTGTFAVNGAVAAGATTMALDGTTVTGTWKKGSLFTIGTATYTVAADATAAANAITITFSPAAPVGGIADNAVVTRIANHAANMAFHKTCFAFVSRPLALPLGGVQSEIVNYGGLGLRVVYDYNSSTKVNTVSLDLLCGVKTLDPMRGVRLLG